MVVFVLFLQLPQDDTPSSSPAPADSAVLLLPGATCPVGAEQRKELIQTYTPLLAPHRFCGFYNSKAKTSTCKKLGLALLPV